MVARLLALGTTSAIAAPVQVSQLNDIPITGSGPGGTFTGTFDINRFAVQGGEPVASR
jgi:hypothetical protein